MRPSRDSYGASLEFGIESDDDENEGMDVLQRHSQRKFLTWKQDFS